jgi:hypothetical protein
MGLRACARDAKEERENGRETLAGSSRMSSGQPQARILSYHTKGNFTQPICLLTRAGSESTSVDCVYILLPFYILGKGLGPI